MLVEDGSSPVVSIRSAQGLPKPEVHARVLGRGHQRAIALPARAARRPAASRSSSVAPAPARSSARPRAASGRVRFAPADGEAERRASSRSSSRTARSRDELTVAHYRAPGREAPEPPARAARERRGSTLRLAWKAARPAAVHEVRVRVADGRRLMFRTSRHTLTVRGVRRNLGAAVTVRGILDTGLAGRPASARAGRGAAGRR